MDLGERHKRFAIACLNFIMFIKHTFIFAVLQIWLNDIFMENKEIRKPALIMSNFTNVLNVNIFDMKVGVFKVRQCL